MKTTIELPDSLFRRVKAIAAERGRSLKDFTKESLQAKLADQISGATAAEPEWMRGFGQLRHLCKETARIRATIDKTFRMVNPKDRA